MQPFQQILEGWPGQRLDSELDEREQFIYLFPMSKPARMSEAAKSNDLPFEEALKKLEAIVETMESGDLPLDTLLARYEEGTRLSQVCQAKLAEADLKIQQLEKTAAGEMKLKPLSADLSEE